MVTNWAGIAECVIRTIVLEVIAFDAVSAAHAAAEGEGDGSLAEWRRAHWAYYQRELAGTGFQLRGDMPVVCEYLTVVDPPPSA